MIKTVIREGDNVIRYGSEEFLILLPNTPLAERMQEFDLSDAPLGIRVFHGVDHVGQHAAARALAARARRSLLTVDLASAVSAGAPAPYAVRLASVSSAIPAHGHVH